MFGFRGSLFTLARLCCTFMLAASAVSAYAEQQTSPAEPLRLEETIRANTEQPRVLTIVPWQLPKHRTVDGALDWQPHMPVPRLLERDSFLRQLAIESALTQPIEK